METCPASFVVMTATVRCSLMPGHKGPHESGNYFRWLQDPIVLTAPAGYSYKPYEPLTAWLPQK